MTLREGDAFMPLFTMDDLEALALAQRSAEEPWQPVTDYSLDGRRLAEGDHPRLLLETFHPQRLLDYGCGPATLIQLLEEQQPTWTHCFQGYEPSPGPLRYGVYQQLPDIIEPYDLVVCREVLEHCTLIEQRFIIAHLCRLSSRFVYVTTRYSSEHDLLKVETRDDLDPTHITLPAKDLHRLLFVLEGFRRRADLEAAMDHKGYGRVLVYERAA